MKRKGSQRILTPRQSEILIIKDFKTAIITIFKYINKNMHTIYGI